MTHSFPTRRSSDVGTDIGLQEGEQLVGPGPVASGDTVRWIIGDTVSGAGSRRRVHILVKPTRSDIMTNMIINTDRRTYHVELRATAASYMASVSWTYPADELFALQVAEAEAARAAPVAGAIDLAALNFRSEEHTSELQSLMRISYDVFCLYKQT